MGDINALVDDFITRLKRRQIDGAVDTAKRTATLLRQVVSAERRYVPTVASGMLESVKSVGARLSKAKPLELAIGNMVRRVLHIVREESVAVLKEAEGEEEEEQHDDGLRVAQSMEDTLQAPALRNLLDAPPWIETRNQSSSRSVAQSVQGEEAKRTKSQFYSLKHNVIERIAELIDEIDNINHQIAEQAIEHIHANEVILSLGSSRTVLTFLREAAKKRTFHVVVAEGSPRYEGQKMARNLASHDIHTTCITDAAVFAMMARVNLVIVGAHGVMANGGVIAPVGVHMVALAAQKHAVPFVVLAGLHKLSPLYPHDPDIRLNEFRSPSEILSYETFADCLSSSGEELTVANPAYDYVPPNLISLFITDTGGHNPSYVYRLLAEYYSPEDYNL